MAQAYQIGLSLSGAISAGAYSAGVLDFLFEALDEWETARLKAETVVPAHAATLAVMSGASAGAITAAVAAIALAAPPEPLLRTGRAGYEYRFRKFYRTWVELPAMVGENGQPDLLGTRDLDAAPRESPRSVLDSSVLDTIADDALACAGNRVPARPYVSARLHLYMTISNLRGVPYKVPFTGGKYSMMMHGDRVHYTVEGLGTWPIGEDLFAGKDATTAELDPVDLFAPPGADERKDWIAYSRAAVASAAFPIGLAPRNVGGRLKDYRDRKWPQPEWRQLTDIKPDWPEWWEAEFGEDRPFVNACVDGGVIDNDPFEYCYHTLWDDPAHVEKMAMNQADRGVIMVAPFPEPPLFLPVGKPGLDIPSILGALFPALQNQVRFKPNALLLAWNDTVGSRFLISPQRLIEDRSRGTLRQVKSLYPIACGLLGGFGGFLSWKFRNHDFQLGRRNCQRFLSHTFRLARENEILAEGYHDPASMRSDLATDATDRKLFEISGELPIIPLLGSAAIEVPAPDWPRIGEAEIAVLLRRLQRRLRKVAARFIRQSVTGAITRWAAGFGLWLLLLLGGRRVHSYLRWSILADLIRRDQLEGWALTTPDGAALPVEQDEEWRLVLAELASPGFDARSVEGLAKACHLEPDEVRAILAACAAQPGRPYRVWSLKWREGVPAYALYTRRPSWFRRTFLRRFLKVDRPA